MTDAPAQKLHAIPTACDDRAGLWRRLFSRRVGAMLARNSVVSCLAFGIGLVLLWVLVRWFAVDKVVAAGIGFLFANSLHYALGRAWIFRGTTRNVHTGYVLFLANSGVGLTLTVILYDLMLRFTALDFLVARAIVSLFAGLLVFILNTVFNFRQL